MLWNREGKWLPSGLVAEVSSGWESSHLRFLECGKDEVIESQYKYSVPVTRTAAMVPMMYGAESASHFGKRVLLWCGFKRLMYTTFVCVGEVGILPIRVSTDEVFVYNLVRTV